MALTQVERNRLYYLKHQEHVCAVKRAYQMKNKDGIARHRKAMSVTKMKETAIPTAEQNIALTRTWWGRP